MANYSLMADNISNSAGNGPPNFPFGFKTNAIVKDLANASYTITDSDGIAFVTSYTQLTGNVSAVLPLAANNIGRIIQFKKSDTGAFSINVTFSGADTLDSQTAVYPIPTQNGSLVVIAIASGKWAIREVSRIAPTYKSYTTGSGTYNVPPYCTSLRVRMVGGGGSGSGSGTGATTASNGIAGNPTTFGGTLLTCNGGGGGIFVSPFNGGAGGSANITLSATVYGTAIAGGSGGSLGNSQNQSTAPANQPGGMGGSSYFGGAGQSGPGSAVIAGGNAAPNSGSGGGGGGAPGIASSNNLSGTGGGAGGFIDCIIVSPNPTYAYSVAASVAGGPAATSGAAGGNGANGFIEILEHYC